MSLNHVISFLKGLPYAKMSSDNNQIMLRCPFCGDSDKHADATHFSIKIGAGDDEPLFYQCFQPDYKCTAKGILNTETLQRLGCTDMKVVLELSKHNAKISKHIDGGFTPKIHKNIVLVNLINNYNKQKIDYINKRLGVSLNHDDLKRLKIQLDLNEFLRINSITKLSFKKPYCDKLSAYTVSFMSMFNDYLICRDVTSDNKMGRRYIMYRISGSVDINDTKIYCIPTELDLLDSTPATLNIAEGTFSILGAYLNTDICRGSVNTIFAANCGTGYNHTINTICKQYGLIKVRINIFSDSEVPVNEYVKLFNTLKKSLDIKSFVIYYNNMKEDFGHKASDISIKTSTIK